MYSLQLKYFIHGFKSPFRRYYSGEAVESVLNVLQNSSKIRDKIKIKGWIKSLRKQKDHIFIDLSDGSTCKKLQVVLSQSKSPKELSTGASISASGSLQLSPKGQIELFADEVKVFGECVISQGYPFAPRKQYPPEYVRQFLHLRPRTNKFASLLRIRSTAHSTIHQYLQSEGYIHIHTPILTSNDCEGAGEVFKVIPESTDLLKSMVKKGEPIEQAFFDTKAFLTVSGQLHLEAAAHGLSKVYTLGPTFRAENSRSRIHLSEFYMLEAEIAFLESLEELICVVEKLVKNTTKAILDKCEDDLGICQGEAKQEFTWLDKDFRVLTYDESIEILERNETAFQSGGYKPEEGISKEHEHFLVRHCGNTPTFIINWPKNIKPFYMKECLQDKHKVLAFDLLVPEVGEVVGGSLREDDCAKLKESLPVDNERLNWYFDLRKFGSVTTGGYGLGFERYLLFLTGIRNIKDVIPFPRWPHNCSM